jgi:hypothetical protein
MAEDVGCQSALAKTHDWEKVWELYQPNQLLDLIKITGVGTALVSRLMTFLCDQHSGFGVSSDAGCRTVLVTDACAGRKRNKPALALYGDCMFVLGSVQQVQDRAHFSK